MKWVYLFLLIVAGIIAISQLVKGNIRSHIEASLLILIIIAFWKLDSVQQRIEKLESLKKERR